MTMPTVAQLDGLTRSSSEEIPVLEGRVASLQVQLGELNSQLVDANIDSRISGDGSLKLAKDLARSIAEHELELRTTEQKLTNAQTELVRLRALREQAAAAEVGATLESLRPAHVADRQRLPFLVLELYGIIQREAQRHQAASAAGEAHSYTFGQPPSGGLELEYALRMLMDRLASFPTVDRAGVEFRGHAGLGWQPIAPAPAAKR